MSDRREIEFDVHVRPGGRVDRIEGDHGGALAVRVTARPQRGEANNAVVVLLARSFGVHQNDVTITAGASSRRKRVRIAGDRRILESRLAELTTGDGAAR